MNQSTGEFQKAKTGWKGRVSLLLFLIVGLSALLWLIMVPREPSYQGKPLTFWLSRAAERNFFDEKDPTVTECRAAIRSIGTNALPALLRILKAKDSKLKTQLADLLERQDYVRFTLQSVEQQKRKADVGFYLLGDLSSNALPELIDLCKHPSPYSKTIAETTLMRLYPAKCVAIPYWLPAEKRAQWYVDTGLLHSDPSGITNALLAFSQAIELEPTNLTAHLGRGDAKMQVHDFTGALDDFENALTLSPSNTMAISRRGACKYGLKDFKAAESDFTAVINLETNDATALNYRGLARANLRDFNAALADFNKAIDMTSYDATIFRNRGIVESILTEYELALADASKSLELNNSDPVAWTLRGRVQCALKNYPAALTNANKAIQLNPKDPNAYSSRALDRICMNDFTNSADDLETALTLNPKEATAFLVRGVLKAKRGGEDDAALADFERAVELSPKMPETYGMLGLFQYKFSKRELALANCRTALHLGAVANVSSYNSYIWLIRAQSGEKDAADQELVAYMKSLDETKTNEWSTITARFFTGSLSESNFINLATTAVKRPSAVTNQLCEAFFYSAMKRKLAGDKPGALELLQKCLDVRDDNCMAYMNAQVEMRALKAPATN